MLPLVTSPPSVSGLANYDIDRDTAAGLLLRRGSRQLWSLPVPARSVFTGDARVVFWAGAENFAVGGSVTLALTLQDCSSSMNNCTTIASATAVASQSVAGFRRVEVSLGNIGPVVEAGRRLALRIEVQGSSPNHGWLAYGTTAFPAYLSIGASPNF